MQPLSTSVQGVYADAYALLLSDYLTARGLSPAAVLGDSLPETDGTKAAGRYPAEQWQRALKLASQALDDPLLGLNLGQTITPSHLGALGYVLTSCDSLAAVLQRFDEYQLLISDVARMRPRLEGDTVTIEWQSNNILGALADETAVTAVVQFARNVTGLPDAPASVTFINPAPESLEPYLKYFGGMVQFDQPVTSIRLQAALLGAKVQKADAALLAMMSQQADAMLQQLPANDDLLHAVRSGIARLAREGEVSLQQVATQLLLSPRTLHRRLAERGYNFRQLREETRQLLAENYLADERLTQGEIAWMLGYSEPSAFSRAFKRRCGQTPGQFRLSLTTRSR